MAFSLEENPMAFNLWDSETPALSVLRMNTTLDNSLDLTGACSTPGAKAKQESLMSSMMSTNSQYMSGWEMPWSSYESETSAPDSNSSRMLGSLFGQPPHKAQGLVTNKPNAGAPDVLEKFSAMAHLNSGSLLGSHSSSHVDSVTSGFNSCPGRLSDLPSSLRITSSMLFRPGMPKDPLKLSLGSHIDHDSSPLTAPPSAPPDSSVSHRRRGASGWPSWDRIKNKMEKEARLHRRAAAKNKATITWNGQLPTTKYRNPVYSCKVFLGGLPKDITKDGLIKTFNRYGPLSVDWRGQQNRHPQRPPQGHAYLVFEWEESVRALLQTCTQHLLHPEGYVEYYFKVCTRSMHCKNVRVIPWVISDSIYFCCPVKRQDDRYTVFVGALHGVLNAEALASIMNDLFGGVMYAGIYTDKQMYPIGSGYVAFNNKHSYMKAVSAAFVEIKTPKLTKKVQIDPYLEKSTCQMCSNRPGHFFCRDQACFKYYCLSCWYWQHFMDTPSNHHPLMLKQKNDDYSKGPIMPMGQI